MSWKGDAPFACRKAGGETTCSNTHPVKLRNRRGLSLSQRKLSFNDEGGSEKLTLSQDAFPLHGRILPPRFTKKLHTRSLELRNSEDKKTEIQELYKV